ncbi:hypothetical protein E6O75_ATG01378 [Venturia nashicola]|uniref:Inhibitor I9 domain-containing protein n=1 Tax=Venturia nashicola TaxID=86259 RepID=A0A4Z1PRW7_9PEZI|nr:hypothetical protein E6O75_ATG01378 [Venturia nashicola]
MSTVMITLKQGASAEQLEKAKKEVIAQGGEIIHESKLIKSITYETLVLYLTKAAQTDLDDSVKFPADKVHTLATNDYYTVEADGEVKIQ